MAGKIKRIWEAFESCFAANHEPLTKAQVIAWINATYPDNDFTLSNLQAQLYRSCFNVPSALKYKAPKILFYNGANKTYRRQDPTGAEQGDWFSDIIADGIETGEEFSASPDTTFVLEDHLQAYLTRNLFILEKGLQLWSISPPSVQYQIDNRFLDILAKDAEGIPVVIELKRKKSYDCAVGQALLYQGLAAARLGLERVRIILVAGTVSKELRIATARLTDVKLFEYSIAMQVKEVSSQLSEDL